MDHCSHSGSYSSLISKTIYAKVFKQGKGIGHIWTSLCTWETEDDLAAGAYREEGGGTILFTKDSGILKE